MPCTPLTCCSIGVATDFSTASASAPRTTTWLPSGYLPRLSPKKTVTGPKVTLGVSDAAADIDGLGTTTTIAIVTVHRRRPPDGIGRN